MADSEKITGAQVRMGRAFLRWSIADLAGKAGVAESTVKRIEQAADIDAAGLATTRDHREAERSETLGKIAKTLGSAGVTFLPDDGKQGPGIRGRAPKAKR